MAFVEILGGKRVAKAANAAQDESADMTLLVEVCKAEKRVVTGVVLQPEVVDAHGDIYSADVIEDSAYQFMLDYADKQAQLGLQHNSFRSYETRMGLVESYVVQKNTKIGARMVKKGSWVMSWKIFDNEIWKQVKGKKLNGFSIGATVRARKL